MFFVVRKVFVKSDMGRFGVQLVPNQMVMEVSHQECLACPLTKQASDRATPRLTTYSHSSNSARVAAIDDTVEHSSVWKASTEQGIE